MYEATDDPKWKQAAEYFQSLFEDHKFKTNNHDLGFIFNCSYGNGYRLTQNEEYKQVMIQAAKSLSTRFNPAVGCIKSWDVNSDWQATRGWKFPVIIDNMMNLEMLFKASEFSGDTKYRDIAITHANTTMRNHYRNDNSSFHVIDYDPETGEVRKKNTAQGYADGSSWGTWTSMGIVWLYRMLPVY
ncbi:glucuronyl hydrolase [Algibacter lectus]|uniref:Glucuronyl hydrolase n=1 Tax=Algibacter lectus TaxID=221126 RepID=A0A090WYM9_9FLAO|nr:glucuronyl hydrolase [Algibacter lectus]